MSKKPDERLAEAAALFKSRNAEYGSSYERFGMWAATLFPNGLLLESESDLNRAAILFYILGKVDRYCINFENGGHTDSLADISVYAAILGQLDDDLKEMKETLE